MKRSKSISTWGLILGFFAILALGIPVWAGDAPKDIKKAEKKGGDITKPERLLAKPKIKEFYCHYVCRDYWNINHMKTGCGLYIHVVGGIHGLKYVEIQFQGHQVFRVESPGAVYKNWVTPNTRPYRPRTSGTYAFEAIAEDMRGNVARKSLSIKADAQYPSFTINAPIDGAVIYSDLATTDVTYDITASDDFSGVRQVRMTFSPLAPAWTRIDSSPPYRFTVPLPPGEYRCMVEVYDVAGNHWWQFTNFSVAPRSATTPPPGD